MKLKQGDRVKWSRDNTKGIVTKKVGYLCIVWDDKQITWLSDDAAMKNVVKEGEK